MKNGEFLMFWGVMLTCVYPYLDFFICWQQTIRRPKNLPWQRDLLEDGLKAAGVTGLDNGAKLYVSNLDAGVTNEDIRVQLQQY